MWKAVVLTFFFLLGGGFASATYELHVVRSNDGFLLVQKEREGLNDIYADIRKWDTAKWRNHPDLAKALVKNGHQNLIKKSIYNDLFGDWLDFDSASRKNNRNTKK